MESTNPQNTPFTPQTHNWLSTYSSLQYLACAVQFPSSLVQYLMSESEGAKLSTCFSVTFSLHGVPFCGLRWHPYKQSQQDVFLSQKPHVKEWALCIFNGHPAIRMATALSLSLARSVTGRRALSYIWSHRNPGGQDSLINYAWVWLCLWSGSWKLPFKMYCF